MPRLASLLASSLAAFLALSGAARAESAPKHIKYKAPEGFAEHKWGDLRATFDRLPAEPLGVGAAWLVPRGESTQPSVMCSSSASLSPMSSGTVETCNIQTILDSARGRNDYGGYYVLSEYAIDGQGFRFGDVDSVLLHPVVYQFCANWYDPKRQAPPKFDELNKFCGMKLLFKSETREELRALPADHVTNYDRVLKKLIGKFGRPAGFAKRGEVVIETLEGESSSAGDRKFKIYRWCPANDRALHTTCSASVTLAMDPGTGRGTVLYSTPLLWEFAYARQNNGFKGDPLFRMLHARK